MVYRYLKLSAVFLAFTLLLAGCEVEKTQEGDMPDVDMDVQTEPGQLPKYDVDAPDVDVGTEKKEIEVPDVDVTMPDEKDKSE